MTRLSSRLFAAVLLSAIGASVVTSGPPPAITLDDVFAEPKDLFSRTLGPVGFEECLESDRTFDCEGSAVRMVTFIVRGATFVGHHEDDFLENGADADLVSATNRLRVRILLPESIDFANATPCLLVQHGIPAPYAPADREVDRKKELVAFELAKRGVPNVLWEECHGAYSCSPIESGRAAPGAPGPGSRPAAEIRTAVGIHTQLGYGSDGRIKRASGEWIQAHAHPSEAMSIDVLRLDFPRYALGQGFLFSARFFERYIEGIFDDGTPPSVKTEWLDALRVVYHGGSKDGYGALAAAGVDQRAAGHGAVSGQTMESDEEGLLHRYQVDWGYNPDPPPGASTGHFNAGFGAWLWCNRDSPSSFADVYWPRRDPDRYRHLLLIDILGTHDYVNPLGSHRRFWSEHDGLVGGLPHESEERWDFVTLRGINIDHGTRYVEPIGRAEPLCMTPASDPIDVGTEDVLVARAMLHRNFPEAWDLPRLDLAAIDVSPGPACDGEPDLWAAIVRITGKHAQPQAQETYRIFLMQGDDRDFRRCDGDGGGVLSDLVDNADANCESPPPGRPHDADDAIDPLDDEEDAFRPCEVVCVEDLEPSGLDGYRRVFFRPPQGTHVDWMTWIVAEAIVGSGPGLLDRIVISGVERTRNEIPWTPDQEVDCEAQAGAGANGPPPLDLDDIFSVPADLFDRALGPRGFEQSLQRSRALDCGGAVIREITYNVGGGSFRGYAPGEFQAHGREGRLVTKTTRLTIRLYLPETIDYSHPTPLVLINHGIPTRGVDSDDRDLNRKKEFMAIEAAKRGIPAILWIECDGVWMSGAAPFRGTAASPPGADTVNTTLRASRSFARKFGYKVDAELADAGYGWLTANAPNETLDAQTLRFDFLRYGLAQGYILSNTFLRRYVEAVEPPSDPPELKQAWLDALRAFYVGGAKDGVAATTATGADRLRCAGFASRAAAMLEADEGGGVHRYQTDWRYLPDPPPGVPLRHRMAGLSAWVWCNRLAPNSYADTYLPSRDPDRYRDLLIVDILGTHDYISPLGSHREFFSRRDGLVGGLPDPGETRWNYRTLRPINKDHGARYSEAVGVEEPICSRPGAPALAVAAGDLLVLRAARHLDRPGSIDLPRLDMVHLDSDPGPVCANETDLWTVTVRLGEKTVFPDADEQFHVFVALGDDRDFRRCDGHGILDDLVDNTDVDCASPTQGRPHDADPIVDPTRNDEDVFFECEVRCVESLDGIGLPEYRRIGFRPPTELANFDPPPMALVIVEARLSVDGDYLNDLVLHTTPKPWNEIEPAPGDEVDCGE